MFHVPTDVQVVPSHHSVLFVCVGGLQQRVPYHRPPKPPLSHARTEQLRQNRWVLQPCPSSRASQLREELQQAEEDTLVGGWCEGDSTLYDLPRPQRSHHNASVSAVDWESSFCSVRNSFTAGARPPKVQKKNVTVEFPPDLDISFHSGLLNTSFNTTHNTSHWAPNMTAGTTHNTSHWAPNMTAGTTLNTSHWANTTTEANKSTLFSTHAVPESFNTSHPRVDHTTETDFYQETDQEKNPNVDEQGLHSLSQRALPESTSVAPPLPVLFYPQQRDSQSVVKRRKAGRGRRV